MDKNKLSLFYLLALTSCLFLWLSTFDPFIGMFFAFYIIGLTLGLGGWIIFGYDKIKGSLISLILISLIIYSSISTYKQHNTGLYTSLPMIQFFSIGYVLSTLSYFDTYTGIPFPFGDMLISRSLFWSLIIPISTFVSTIIDPGSIIYLLLLSALISLITTSTLCCIFIHIFSSFNQTETLSIKDIPKLYHLGKVKFERVRRILRAEL